MDASIIHATLTSVCWCCINHTTCSQQNLCSEEYFKLTAEPFSGDKRRLKEFCENVEAGFELSQPDQYERNRISDEAKAKQLAGRGADDGLVLRR
jgi:hypothetical protein